MTQQSNTQPLEELEPVIKQLGPVIKQLGPVIKQLGPVIKQLGPVIEQLEGVDISFDNIFQILRNEYFLEFFRSFQLFQLGSFQAFQLVPIQLLPEQLEFLTEQLQFLPEQLQFLSEQLELLPEQQQLDILALGVFRLEAGALLPAAPLRRAHRLAAAVPLRLPAGPVPEGQAASDGQTP